MSSAMRIPARLLLGAFVLGALWLPAIEIRSAAAAEAESAAVAETAGAPAGEREGPPMLIEDSSGSAGEARLLQEDPRVGEWLHPEPYLYRSAGRRDPFASLLPDGEEQADLEPGVADLIVVGILWGDRDRLALVETRQGKGLILREGDRVRDGRVLAISVDGVAFVQYYYGLSRRVNLPMVSSEEVGNER
ncbi:MAG: hypothetical protein V1774_00980 [Candidatus Eisenbacteria bacterium]